MNNAYKIYEAHIHTVHLSDDPLILEFMNNIFPLVQECIDLEHLVEHKASLLEADGQLQWNDIDAVFRAAQKASKGGVLDRAVGAGKEKLTSAKDQLAKTIQKKLIDMVTKYETQAPIKNASVKVDKLKKRAVSAISSQESDPTGKLVKQIDKIVDYASNNPKLANIVIAVLSTVISFSKSTAATFAIGVVLDASLSKLQKQMGERNQKTTTYEASDDVENLRKVYSQAFSNATRLVSPKKRSKVERSIEKLFKYGQTDSSKAQKVLSIMKNIAAANTPAEIASSIKKARSIQTTNESLERILWGS